MRDVAIIAAGEGVRVRRRLNRNHGRGRWRKMKGQATVQLNNGMAVQAEVHWYEAHGIGRKDFKIKRLSDERVRDLH